MIVKPSPPSGLPQFLRPKDVEVRIMDKFDVMALKQDLQAFGLTIHPDHDSVVMGEQGSKSLNPEHWNLFRLNEIILFYGKKNFAYCSLSGQVDKSFKFFVW